MCAHKQTLHFMPIMMIDGINQLAFLNWQNNAIDQVHIYFCYVSMYCVTGSI